MKDAKQLAAEVRESGLGDNREARDLTLSERHEVEDLVCKAESQGRTELFVKSSGYKQNADALSTRES